MSSTVSGDDCSLEMLHRQRTSTVVVTLLRSFDSLAEVLSRTGILDSEPDFLGLIPVSSRGL